MTARKTFRQFLEDIEVDDGAYSPEDSQNTLDTVQRELRKDLEKGKGSWKELPVKFPYEGFKVMYEKHYEGFNIALMDTRDVSNHPMPAGFVLPRDKDRVAVNINVSPRKDVHLLIDGEKKNALRGVQTDVLSSDSRYRGSRLAPLLYETLVRHGQVLFSSNTQTSGGRATWEHLTQRLDEDGFDVGVLIDSAWEASKLLEDYEDLNPAFFNKMKEENAQYMKKHNTKKYEVADFTDELSSKWLVVGSLQKLTKIAYDDSHAIWVVAPPGTFDQYREWAIKVK